MRDERIDILRFIGLSLIILAHVDPPALIFQARNFDVPMMVMVSGLSFSLSYKGGALKEYVIKRFRRLVLPVWAFLTIYFLVLAVLPQGLPNLRMVASSYALMSGIGYVWIIRVFLMVALVAPLIYRLNKSTQSDFHYGSALVAAWIGYEVLRYLLIHQLTVVAPGALIDKTLFHLVPYALIFALGLRLASAATSLCRAAFVLCGLAFLTLAATEWSEAGHFVQTQDAKYPPLAYYASYAIAISTLCWMTSDRMAIVLNGLGANKAVGFIAANSIWIYLWHIPIVELVSAPWWILYGIAYTFAITVCRVQREIVLRVVLPRTQTDRAKRLVLDVFTG